MHYRAHGRCCAVDITAWNLPLSREDAVQRLTAIGFRRIDVDIVGLARELVGCTAYQRGAPLSMAPLVVDCSGFVKWLYGHRGVWLPRRAAQQFLAGAFVADDDIRPGDLVFRKSGDCPSPKLDPADVTHVGIVGSDGEVLHAMPGIPGGIACGNLENWQSRPTWRGARRCIPHGREVLTLQAPTHLDIESSDDVRWSLLETLVW